MSSKHVKLKIGEKTEHHKTGLLVEVRHNDIEKALRILKRKINQEGLLKELRDREYFVRPGEKKRRKMAEAVNRWHKTRKMIKEELGI